MFDGPARQRAFAHFCKVGHRPYRDHGFLYQERDPGRVVRCAFCATNMIECGGGPNKTFYVCPGCDKQVIQPHDHSTPPIVVPRGKSFFDATRADEESAGA